MTLPDYFNECTTQAKQLLEMYNSLDWKKQKVRSERRDKIFNNKIFLGWGKKEGIWCLVNNDESIRAFGKDKEEIFCDNIKNFRPIILQHSLVMMMAAVDKILHHATTTKNFSFLLKNELLDNLIKGFPLSETYNIAMESRKRWGKGGKSKPRPANKIKEIFTKRFYEISFLGKGLEDVCAANGAKKIFSLYADYLGRKNAKPLKDQWFSIYRKRNAIVHECTIKRTAISPKKISFESYDEQDLKKDIDFVEKFGKFIAQKL